MEILSGLPQATGLVLADKIKGKGAILGLE
jgi:hypothetical protein